MLSVSLVSVEPLWSKHRKGLAPGQHEAVSVWWLNPRDRLLANTLVSWQGS